MFLLTLTPRRIALGVLLILLMAGAADGQSQRYHVPQRLFPLPFPTPIRPAEGSARMQQLKNLKAWNVALIQYLQDQSHSYPDMRSAAAVKKTLWRYVLANKGGVDPVTKRLYQPNPFLSHKPAALSDPSRVVTLYEAKPDADHTRAVGFADGHCLLILEREWPRLKRESHVF